MALFTITEPGQSKPRATARHKRGVGIDLGTTNSLVAVAKEGKAETLPDAQGRHLLPSIVHYFHNPGGANCEVAVGEYDPAVTTHPVSSISSVKRLMGRGIADIDYQLPYELKPASDGGMPLITTVQGLLSPVQVSAEILKVLAARGAAALGGELDGTVITVPAYFDEAQRHATRDAARLAGLKVLRLLSEPTAAAIAYGLDTKLEGTIIIYDLGGGTFDVSLMKLQRGVFEVLATGGNAALGGDDFDRAIGQWILDQAQVSLPSADEFRELFRVARECKHRLTDTDAVPVAYSNWSGVLTHTGYYALIDNLIDQTLKSCRRVLRDAGIDNTGITEVVLVGGATRSPRIRQKVQEFFGREPLCSIDPDRVVALGAALQADVLVGNKYGNEMLLLDVIPLSLGIETMGGLMEKIIPRNTTIPVTRAQDFTTFKDGQTAMLLHVLQGERELITDCRSLARFELRGIPPMVAGAARIRVSFQVDADGLLEVAAQEINSKVHSSIVVKPSFGLQEQDIETMLLESQQRAQEDKELRSLRENQVEALRHLEALEAALHADGDALLTADERARLEQSMAGLRTAMAGTDAALIDKLIHELNTRSTDFAAMRMDRGIKAALAGHTLEEIGH